MIFLARHGQPHRIAPHLINYRANVWLLRELGASVVLATNAVGSIADAMAPGDLMLPHQIIDYTWGRSHTYMDTLPLQHVDFSDAVRRGVARSFATRGARTRTGLLGIQCRCVRMHARSAARKRGRDRPHGSRRLRRGRHDRHAGSRARARTRTAVCVGVPVGESRRGSRRWSDQRSRDASGRARAACIASSD